jgi:hypothetical protein
MAPTKPSHAAEGAAGGCLRHEVALNPGIALAMRAMGTFAAALCSMLALAASAGATGGGTARDYVFGTGTGHFQETGGPFSLSVAAWGDGPLAQGYVRGSGDYLGEFRVEGPVTCTSIVGNRASIKYRFRRSQGPGAPPQNGGVQVYIEDNGRTRNGQPVDRVATEPPLPPGVFDATAEVCTPPQANPAWTRIETGDYVVHDAG